jgi:hypothetical protein
MKTSVLLAAVLMLAACTSTNQPSSNGSQPEPPKPAPPQLETARYGYQQMLNGARLWAADAQPFRLESVATSEANGQGGKSAVWRGSFGSASRGKMEKFVWSGAGAESKRGVDHGVEDFYSPMNATMMTFDTAYWKSDSDAAYDVAQKHGGEKLVKANPKTPVTFVLDYDSAHRRLTWHVSYAPQGAQPLTIDVNATTGQFIGTER